MTLLFVRVHTAAITLLTLLTAGRDRSDRGQTTAEYALVLLGVAAIALLVVAWARSRRQVQTAVTPAA